MFMEIWPRRYVIETVSVPEAARLIPARGVRVTSDEETDPRASAIDLSIDPPPERRRPSLIGWLVDVDEGA
ncbi:hypothetical protein ACEXQD_06715 [Herbiconiux sp. P15]|uniref:hypothetical protein n=1 Tax=Herbiconiux liukaitaii TaxID=3342799 RepID=UPI0035BA2F8B